MQRSKENRRKARDDIVIRELFEQSMAEYRERLRAAELYARDMRKAHEKKEADVVASFANWYVKCAALKGLHYYSIRVGSVRQVS